MRNMKTAIDIIEGAKSYYLLSNDKKSKPMFVGGRIRLEIALEGIKKDMVIATAGNDKRCVVLVDYTGDEVFRLVSRVNKKLLKLKAKN